MQIEPHKPKIQSVSPYGTANDVFQTIFAHETNLNSEDLGQVVKSLSELRKIITTTENKLLLNSVISKIATNFEGVKNIHKYQYLEFFRELKPFYQNIQNKKEVLDIVSKILTSNDYISRIISTQFITLLKEHLEDRVDVFHNLMSVALSTKSQLEIRFLFKSFLELCEASEAFSFTFLQQFRQVFEKFAVVTPKKKFLVLIQKAARNISKEQNLTILSQNLKLHLELDLKIFQNEHKNMEMIHANIILMGNLLLYTFSHTSEIIPLVVGTFFFLIENPVGSQAAQEDAYHLCILIIHLFKRMFKVIPTLKMVLKNEMTQMMNKVVNGSHLDSSLNNMLFLELSSLVDIMNSKDNIAETLTKISDDTKLTFIMQTGASQDLFDSHYIKELFCSRIEQLTANYPSDLFTHEYMKLIRLLKSLNDQNIIEIFKDIKTRIITALKNPPLERKPLLGLVEMALLTMVSLNLRVQSTGVYPSNVFLILQDDISPILALLKSVEKNLFGELFKKIFLMILELGKMAISTQTNPHRYENAVLENMKTIKTSFTKSMLFWMIQKAFTNNYFILCKWLLQGLTHMTKAEKILVWLDTLKNLCLICTTDSKENKTLELFKTMSSTKLIKSENTFSYQYLRCLIFLHSGFQEIRTLIHNKGSMDKPLSQIYEYVVQLKLLKDKYFIDNMSKVSLKVFLYSVQFIIALLENPIELEDNPRSLEERLELINNKIEKWIAYLPFHNGEIELMKYFRNSYQKTLMNRDWNNLRTTILDDFLNFKIIVFPRVFLDLKPAFNLTMRLVNQDEFINKKTNEINANSSFRYVLDIRVHFSHLPKDFKENLTLRAEAIVDFHHNYGSPEDVIHHVSRINQSHTISPSQKHVEMSFLLNFTSIGKFTFKVTLNLFNKKSRIISTLNETWLINAY